MIEAEGQVETNQKEPLAERLAKTVGTRRVWLRQFIGEATGTAILLMFGNGVITQCEMVQGHGSFLSMCVAWGIGIIMAVLASGKNGSAHLNPAVSVAAATLGELPWWKVPIYVTAQIFGGFLGSLVIFVVYHQAIVAFSENFRNEHNAIGNLHNSSQLADNEYKLCLKIAKLFTTFPGEQFEHASVTTTHVICMIDSIVGTALLKYGALSITDKSNYRMPEAAKPALLGAMICALVACFAGNSAAPLNPARDLGPRLMVTLVGYHRCSFSGGHYYFYIPIIFTTLGAIIGGWLYRLTVTAHLPAEHRYNHAETTAPREIEMVAAN